MSDSTERGVTRRPVERLKTLKSVGDLPPWRSEVDGSVDIGATHASLERLQDEALHAAPPDGDQAAFRAVDPAGWVVLSAEIGRLHALNPLRQARLLAMVATSMASAVRANQGRSAHAAPRVENPDLDRSSDAPIAPAAEAEGRVGPADSVAAAGAASAVLSGLFPSDARRVDGAARQARAVAALSGQWTPADMDAAWAIGRKAGASTLTNSRSDGSGTKVPYTKPMGGTWELTPPVFGAPVEPGGGKWRSWNACAGRVAPLGDPPRPGSVDFERAVEEIVELSAGLTDGNRRLIDQWSLGPGSATPPGRWMTTLADLLVDGNIAVEDQVVALSLLGTVLADTGILVWREKYSHDLVRPITEIRASGAADWSPVLVTPAFPSYPSGHSAFSAAAASVLAGMFPDRQAEFIRAFADAGDSRVLGGIHYWFDNKAGMELGSAVADGCHAIGLSGPVPPLAELAAAAQLDQPPRG